MHPSNLDHKLDQIKRSKVLVTLALIQMASLQLLISAYASGAFFHATPTAAPFLWLWSSFTRIVR
jgi:hypothetical protein